jgi:excisionase family DNA binding protein
MTRGREYLRAAEIAALMGMSVRTIRRWIKDEVLSSTKIGGARLVAATDLNAALSESHAGLEDLCCEVKEPNEKSDE